MTKALFSSIQTEDGGSANGKDVLNPLRVAIETGLRQQSLARWLQGASSL
jgi:hypothetical protein